MSEQPKIVAADSADMDGPAGQTTRRESQPKPDEATLFTSSIPESAAPSRGLTLILPDEDGAEPVRANATATATTDSNADRASGDQHEDIEAAAAAVLLMPSNHDESASLTDEPCTACAIADPTDAKSKIRIATPPCDEPALATTPARNDITAIPEAADSSPRPADTRNTAAMTPTTSTFSPAATPPTIKADPRRETPAAKLSEAFRNSTPAATATATVAAPKPATPLSETANPSTAVRSTAELSRSIPPSRFLFPGDNTTARAATTTSSATTDAAPRGPKPLPERVGNGRLQPTKVHWKPGEPLGGAAVKPADRRRFRWDVMLSTACGTAACGMIGIWLIRALLS